MIILILHLQGAQVVAAAVPAVAATSWWCQQLLAKAANQRPAVPSTSKEMTPGSVRKRGLITAGTTSGTDPLAGVAAAVAS